MLIRFCSLKSSPLHDLFTMSSPAVFATFGNRLHFELGNYCVYYKKTEIKIVLLFFLALTIHGFKNTNLIQFLQLFL